VNPLAESINDLDEVKILGYFETIRSTFLMKVALLTALNEPDSRAKVHPELLRAAKATNTELPDDNFITALGLMNRELILNLMEDAASGVISASWLVFEQIIKDLAKPNYSTDPSDISANYERNLFGFTKAEKADIALFYYIRNGMLHYNGSYYAYRDIDHTYDGIHYRSAGHLGEKMPVNIRTAYRICGDLERYSMRAWSAAKSGPPART
jgi:hypothetical protein